jgi:hypothetical protein
MVQHERERAMAITHADRFRWEQDVLANPNLTATQKIVLTRLALHLNIKTGQCNPSVKTLATGAGVAERTVQATLSRAETLGIIERAIGGGRTRTTSYTLVSPAKTVHDAAPFSETAHDEAPFPTVHGAAPFSETVHDEAPFEMETVHASVEKGAADSEKPCTAVHPNIKNKRNTDERLKEEFDRWYPVYPRRSARRAAFKSYKQARSRGATPETLLHGAKRYAAQRAGQDPQFTKMPATWLNGDCWLDEPEIQLADIPAAPSGNAEGLSMAERIAAAAKRALGQ